MLAVVAGLICMPHYIRKCGLRHCNLQIIVIAIVKGKYINIVNVIYSIQFHLLHLKAISSHSELFNVVHWKELNKIL